MMPGKRTDNPFRYFCRWAGVLLSATLLVACETVQTTRGGVVGVDRPQMMAVPAQQVESTAQQQYAAIIDEARKKGALNRDAAEVQRVRRISQRLIAQTGAFRDDASRWNWEVNVIESDQVNAWAMPGGKIAVYSGLIDKLKLSDAELAAVIGHEIAHALREHARERMTRAMPVALGASVLGALYGEGAGQLSNVFGQAMFVLPNSRENEQEADRIGVELAARAGYDPRAAISLWQKMAAGSGSGGGFAFLSTHPTHDTRIRDLQVYADRVMPLYERATRP